MQVTHISPEANSAPPAYSPCSPRSRVMQSPVHANQKQPNRKSARNSRILSGVSRVLGDCLLERMRFGDTTWCRARLQAHRATSTISLHPVRTHGHMRPKAALANDSTSNPQYRFLSPKRRRRVPAFLGKKFLYS